MSGTVESSRDRSCHWHPQRRGGVTCQRCDRPLCPDCMHQASVGFHCPECTASRGAPSITGVRQIHQAASGSQRATQALLLLNILAFAYSVIAGGSARSLTSLDPTVMEDGALLARALSNSRSFHLVGVDAGEYYRLVTYAFLHDGLLHLAFNMYAIWLLGQLLEAGFGAARFVSLCAASMLGGAFGALLTTMPNVPTVGASGVAFGLMGAMLLVQRAIGGRLWRSPLGALLLINLGITLVLPGVSVGGHFGGLGAGLVMGAAMLAFERRKIHAGFTVAFGALLSAALVLASVVAAAG